MSVFSKEKTYEFSRKGWEECKNDNWINKFNECDPVKYVFLATGIIIATGVILSPLGSAVAYKAAETELIQVAFKALGSVL